VFAWVGGCAAEPHEGAGVTIKLTVPESSEHSKHNNLERGYKLIIDGKDYSEPKKTERTVKVPLKEGQDKVTIKYTFWPNNYTGITRTKVIPLEKGKDTYTVNLLKEDPKNKDDIVVIFVPTPDNIVEEMCKLAKVGKDDVVWDIGCGDGRMVITAVEKFGARKGRGIDIDPERIKECKERLKKTKVEDKVIFEVGDALKIKDVSEATVILLYMGDDIGARLSPVLRETLKPGARVVSHRFKLGDWQPDRTENVQGYELHIWTIKEKKKEK
jgi:ribosomal protein L11 methylase PrmA